MMHVNTEKEQNEITHIYLKEAKVLRPDLGQKN
jgi:chorismate mutase